MGVLGKRNRRVEALFSENSENAVGKKKSRINDAGELLAKTAKNTSSKTGFDKGLKRLLKPRKKRIVE